MPTYRLTAPGQPDELLEAHSAHVEGLHTVLRGTVYVMGRPREVIVRRAPLRVRIEEVVNTTGGDVVWCARQFDDN